MPGPVQPVELSVRREAVKRLTIGLSAWHRRHAAAARIRILTPVPVARWADDMALLLEEFPHAVLEVHVSEEYAGEVGGFMSPRIDVRIVRGRKRAWVVRLCRCAVSRPTPTILLTGEALAGWSWVATAVLFPSDPMAATRMNDVVLALRAMAAEASRTRDRHDEAVVIG